MRQARLLGAVIAGGQSSRFGSDKAAALLSGKSLLAHVIDTLDTQTDDLVICGRSITGRHCLPDRPRPGLGPLGGIAAALRHAADNGFTGILTSACDTPRIPANIASRLCSGGPAILAGQPLLGFWPSGLADVLDRYLHSSTSGAVYGWVKVSGARTIGCEVQIPNINYRADLAALDRISVHR